MNEKAFDCVKKICDDALKEPFIPCSSFLLIQDGKEVCYYENGHRNIEKDLPFTRDSICHLFSLSKPITSLATYMLIERGLISLSEPVSRYLPGFSALQVEENGMLRKPKRAVRIRELLSMQSGLLYNGKGLAGEDGLVRFNEIENTCMNEDSMTTVEFADYLGHGIAQFDPRDGWAYGSSADILGAVIEVASGKRFGDFLREEIFEPLGMKDTGFFIPPEKLDRMAVPYKLSEEGWKRDTHSHLGVQFAPTKAPNFESGGAGIFSTLNDMVRFGTMLLGEGEAFGKRLITRETARVMRTPQLTEEEMEWYWKGFPMNRGFNFGNLMRINAYPEKGYSFGVPGEFGWDGWMGCYMSVIPSKNALMLFMTQRGGAAYSEVVRKLRNVSFSQILE